MSAPSGIATWSGLSLPGRTGGPYRVIGVLAAGGMAFVLRATDTATNRGVVLKVPKPQLLADDTIAKRFAREIHTLTKFTHPHVVRVLDVGEFNGLPFMVMPLLAGGSLRDRSQGQAMPPASLRGWLAAIGDALDAVHAQGTLHRDVKPDNILFDADGIPQLTDFGVVKGVGADGLLAGATEYTGQGGILGTVPYMAPELLQGQRIDARTDQFALAATVFEVLAGRVPFDGTNVGAVMMSQLRFRQAKKPPPLAAPGVTPELAAAVLRGLGYTPDERYTNCRTFAAAVLQHVPAAPLPPAPPPAPGGSGSGVRTVSTGVGDTRAQPRPPAPQPLPPPPVAPRPPQPIPPPHPDPWPAPSPVAAPVRPQTPIARQPQVVPVDLPPPPPPPEEKILKATRVRDDRPLIPEDELPSGRGPRKRNKWWVRTERGSVLGPYTTAEVRELFDTGKLKEYDQVSPNQRDWSAIGSNQEFEDLTDQGHRKGGRPGAGGGMPWWVWLLIVGGALLAIVILLVVMFRVLK